MVDIETQLQQADALAARAHREAAQYPRVMVVLGLVWGAFVLAMGLVPAGLLPFLAVLVPFAVAIGVTSAWMARLGVNVGACVRSIRIPLVLSAVSFGFGLLLGIVEREGEDVFAAPVLAVATAAPLLIGAWRYRRRLRQGLVA